MGEGVTKVKLSDVPRRVLAGGSWSAMLLTSDTVAGNDSSMGYSLFVPGSISDSIAHDAEELIYVSKGRGQLRTDRGDVDFDAGDALHVPRGVWHWIANTGNEDVVMVFGFPSPNYPATERRASA